MKRQTSEVRKQHYVPQFLLRHFAEGDRIWVFDKEQGCARRQRVAEVACENGFYTDAVPDSVSENIEGKLAELEGIIAPIIDRTLKTRQLSWQSPGQREMLALFVAVQMFRTPTPRKWQLELRDLLLERAGRGAAAGPVPDGALREIEGFGPKDAAEASIKLMLSSAHEVALALLGKEWYLQHAKPKNGYYISDNPVALHNGLNSGHRGVKRMGIEVHLPLSDALSLAMICPVLAAACNRRASQVGDVAPVAENSPVPLFHEHVRFQNSLQVISSERFVFARHDQFKLVRAMIRDYPPLKIGLRPVAV